MYKLERLVRNQWVNAGYSSCTFDMAIDQGKERSGMYRVMNQEQVEWIKTTNHRQG